MAVSKSDEPARKKLVINIAASGRFHLLDVARELEKQGNTVRFYSYVPTRRAMKFGLKRECCFSLFPLMFPFLVLLKLSHRAAWSEVLHIWVLDHLVALLMKPCDVFIAISNIFDTSFTAAKKKYNAVTIVERGSKHVHAVSRIYMKNPALHGEKPYPDWLRDRELHNYEICDYISIPADHVRRSFLENGVPEEKLLVNTYGVDLKMFQPTELKAQRTFDVLFVGNWSWSKGCDLLAQACKDMGLSLLHAGSVGDYPFPSDPAFVSLGFCDQSKLGEVYSQARIFAIPSRQEGLALVQVQALACGLPLVCSADSGGRDLRPFLKDPKWIVEMARFDLDELKKCLQHALKLAETQQGLRVLADNSQMEKQLSWSAYGTRYQQYLMEIIKERS